VFNEHCSLVKLQVLVQIAGMKIGRDQITEAALALMQEHGLDGLGMRALAERLGVRASALYWHVPSKGGLYALMTGHFYGTAYAQASTAPGPQEWLERLGATFRESLLAYRDSARLCAIAPPAVSDTPEAKEQMTVDLTRFGLTQEQALNAVASVFALTLGWVVYEQSETMHDHLVGMLDFDTAFSAGLQAIVGGLVAAQTA
jgi:TetR/AcrR family transcriptional regulator, tetracycline repressor protein